MKEKPILPPPGYPIPQGPMGMGMPWILTDPMGSYTGRPLDEGEVPVQDADDL